MRKSCETEGCISEWNHSGACRIVDPVGSVAIVEMAVEAESISDSQDASDAIAIEQQARKDMAGIAQVSIRRAERAESALAEEIIAHETTRDKLSFSEQARREDSSVLHARILAMNTEIARLQSELAACRTNVEDINQDAKREIEAIKRLAKDAIDEAERQRDAALTKRSSGPGPMGQEFMIQIDQAVKETHGNAVIKGFWNGIDMHDPNHLLARIALIHSEVSEAAEDVRVADVFEKPYSVENGKPVGFGYELADIVIRVFDLAGATNINMGKMIVEKHAYNVTRKPMHGKRA